jgi:hypothetical protein
MGGGASTQDSVHVPLFDFRGPFFFPSPLIRVWFLFARSSSATRRNGLDHTPPLFFVCFLSGHPRTGR